ncbi:MAG: iron-sulfur cluster assembly scaffold protein [Candidatus Thermoplasmatota archaeon]|jgi:nitrogen fixation NifU-like protein|nr:iron-sulfur cluster assembly scaffold protein [Candidatus Thermoplasmatota archaeon]MCL5793908.1 iron-sulfur cluster assembly scaffold protein [Candidatus Thermoplasmatota archaeon]
MNDEEISVEAILDHYRNPHNYGKLESSNASFTEFNPICGDTVHIQLSIADGTIQDARFVGRGCSVSQASASMLTDLLKGKKVEFLESMTEPEFLGILGIKVGPAREKCALLSLTAAKKAVKGAT